LGACTSLFFLKKTGKGKGLYVYIHQLGAGGEL
jgi:hypothetical protein